MYAISKIHHYVNTELWTLTKILSDTELWTLTKILSDTITSNLLKILIASIIVIII